jgi:hypothetical protein
VSAGEGLSGHTSPLTGARCVATCRLEPGHRSSHRIGEPSRCRGQPVGIIARCFILTAGTDSPIRRARVPSCSSWAGSCFISENRFVREAFSMVVRLITSGLLKHRHAQVVWHMRWFLGRVTVTVLTGFSTSGALRRLQPRFVSHGFGPVGGLAMRPRWSTVGSDGGRIARSNF